MPVTLRSGRSSSRPLVMYAGRPKAASPSPIRETTGPPAPSVAVGMRIRLRRSLTMATTVPAAYSHVIVLGRPAAPDLGAGPLAAIGPRYATVAGSWAVYAAWSAITLTLASSWCSAVALDRSAPPPEGAPGQIPGHVLGARRISRIACFTSMTARISRSCIGWLSEAVYLYTAPD